LAYFVSSENYLRVKLIEASFRKNDWTQKGEECLKTGTSRMTKKKDKECDLLQTAC
jgi:hypothetical protein